MADAAGKDDMVESADSRGHGRDGLRDPDCEELHGELGLRAGIGKQHAHVAMPGDSGKACTAVQAIFKRLRIQAFMPQQIQRSEEHTSEHQSLIRISYALFCLKKKTQQITLTTT